MGGEAPGDKRKWGLDRLTLRIRGGGRVERMRGGGINATISWQRRDDRGGGKSDEEWESLMALREANGAETTTTTVDDNIGALRMENETTEGTINEGAVYTIEVVLCNTLTMYQLYLIFRPRRVGRPNQAYVR